MKRPFLLCADGTRSIKEMAKQIGNEGLNRGGSRTPMPTASAHKILRQPIYMGEFEWAGKMYKGSHEPLVPRDLWQHDEAVAKLKADHQRIQDPLDVLYEDKLDGSIDAAFIDRKAREFRAQQNTILKSIEDHESAIQSYMEEGIRMLELASRAADLIEKQPAEEKRRLLNWVLEGAPWQRAI